MPVTVKCSHGLGKGIKGVWDITDNEGGIVLREWHRIDRMALA